jgi:cytochrome c6
MKAKHTLLSSLVMFAVGLPIATAADAKANWDEHCASCHGATGKADTKMGQRLKLKDYTDAKVQTELTDEVLLKATLDGVVVDGKQKMKGYADKLSADDAKAIVGLIRSFKK